MFMVIIHNVDTNSLKVKNRAPTAIVLSLGTLAPKVFFILGNLTQDATFPDSFGLISHIHLGKIPQEMFGKGWAVPEKRTFGR